MDPFRKKFKNWLQFNQRENNSLKNEENKENEDTEGLNSPEEIAFENSDFRLIVQKGSHKRQKNFRLQDHLFYFKVQQKGKGKLPLLINILDFLHSSFLHVLESVKSFYTKGL